MSGSIPAHQRHFPNSPPYVTGLIGLVAFLLCFFLWPKGVAGSPTDDFHLFLAIIAFVMVLVDVLVFRVYLQPEVSIDWADVQLSHIKIHSTLLPKIVAAAMVGLVTLIFYQTIELYQDDWYRRFTDLLYRNSVAVGGLALIYIIAIDCLTNGKADGLSNFGLMILSLGRSGNRRVVADLSLSWLIKLFFLPLMYGYALDDWLFFYGNSTAIDGFRSFYEFMYRFLFFTDVIFAVVGYSLTLRLLNTHVRQPERAFSGWFICLMCYMPFWQVFGRSYFNYSGNSPWGPVFEPYPILYWVWGSIILLALCCYVASTLAFGLRFSNLTYRGVIYRGPYSLTKHPAYLSKCLTMWMVSLPFLSSPTASAISNVLALIGVNLIYYVRARHEENCCRQDHDYRVYERLIRRHGAFARVASFVDRICRIVQKRIEPVHL